MKRKNIWQEIELELRAGKKKHPNWPDHIAACAGIVCEEAGELMRECLNHKYEGAKANDPKKQVKDQQRKAQIIKEAIHTAAVAIRFLENIK